MQVSTIRPGLLVSMRTGLRGNVSYSTRVVEEDHIEDDGSRRAAWETNRMIELPGEHEEAVKVRGKARSLITAVCSPSSFGLLCPEAMRDKLTIAIDMARAVITDFNERATVTRASLHVIIGRVASDDVEAIRAINSEVRDLLTAMEDGLKKLDVDAVREAANKARSLSAMLSPEAAGRAQKAIDVARSAARQIVKAGETAAVEIDEATFRTITQARAAFLDLDDAAEIQEPTVTGRAIDLEADGEVDVENIFPKLTAPREAMPAYEL